jgi:DNA-binding protein WhiA
VPDLLLKVGLMEAEQTMGHGVAAWVVRKRCCRRAYLRGAFLAAGAINDPNRGSYHMEIATQYEEQKVVLCQLLRRERFSPKTVNRKDDLVVYLKEGEQIVRFLNIIGAHTALLQFEEARVHKEMRNQVNRLVNAETANLNKTADAAVRQAEAIKQIKQKIGLAKLSPGLLRMAELRLNNPDSSLQELGELADPPLSKSAVNHRLRKLMQIASSLAEGDVGLE